MRVAIVRSDIQKIYLNDVESRVQRDFSREPPGQSRYFHKPSNAEFLAFLNTYTTVAVRGTTNTATVDTTVGANVIRIRTNAAAAYSVITVTSNAALPVATLAADLNTGFAAAGLALVATVVTGSNRIQIDTLTTGPAAHIDVDSVAHGSTLCTVIGVGPGVVVVSGLDVVALKAAVYPTSVTVNVAPATILALSTFSLMTSIQQRVLVAALQDLVAPHLVETGMVLLSFAYGNLAKMRVASFWPGGARSGIPAGIAAAIVEDDGVTVFTV